MVGAADKNAVVPYKHLLLRKESIEEGRSLLGGLTRCVTVQQCHSCCVNSKNNNNSGGGACHVCNTARNLTMPRCN
jgi:hypothetical protein